MNKIVFSTLLWLTSVMAHSQYTDPLIIANTDYMELSKKQKKAGWICIGASVVFITTAILLPENFSYDQNPNGLSTSGSISISGLCAMKMGVTLLFLSTRNKRKGINLLLRKETVLQLQKNRFSNAAIPALSLRLNL